MTPSAPGARRQMSLSAKEKDLAKRAKAIKAEEDAVAKRLAAVLQDVEKLSHDQVFGFPKSATDEAC